MSQLTAEEEIKQLRLRADTLSFLDRLKKTNKKDFSFRLIQNASGGTTLSVDINNNPSKLHIDDCAEEFRNLLTNFFENKLNPKKEEPVAELVEGIDFGLELISCTDL